MQRIKIISTPPGEAPEEVRQEWVGLVIPLAVQQESSGKQTGALGGKPENEGGYKVAAQIALDLLKRKSSEAWWWWMRSHYRGYSHFVFDRSVCELVD